VIRIAKSAVKLLDCAAAAMFSGICVDSVMLILVEDSVD
jgi:hypothetical protein